MRCRIFFGIGILVGSISVNTDLSAQTRFTVPDTTINFSKYVHVEECISTFSRMSTIAKIKDPVWADTLNVDIYQSMTHLPDSVVSELRTCLSKFDVDTIPFESLKTWVPLLLAANKDQDLDRLVVRLADSISADSSRQSYFSLLYAYFRARPVRIEKLTQLYEMGLSMLHPDSVNSGLLLRSMVMGEHYRIGNYDLSKRIAEDIMSITDTLSAKYKTTEFEGLMKGWAYPFIALLMTQEATDSISSSSIAYRNYLIKISKRLLGTEWSEPSSVFGMQVPEPQGHFWYSNLNNDSTVRKIEAQQVIRKGEVTLMYFVPGCHSTSTYVKVGRASRGGNCYQTAHKIRKIKKLYPQINVVIVTNTFGAFGAGAPLTPQQEADTLASYFLDFYQLKGTHIIYQTDFMRLPWPDNRRIDHPTENYTNFTLTKGSLAGNGAVLLIDEEGRLFSFGGVVRENEHAADGRLKAVMDRVMRTAVH